MVTEPEADVEMKETAEEFLKNLFSKQRNPKISMTVTQSTGGTSLLQKQPVAIFNTIQMQYPEETNNTDPAVFLPEPYYEMEYPTQTGEKQYIRMPGIIIDLTDTE